VEGRTPVFTLLLAGLYRK